MALTPEERAAVRDALGMPSISADLALVSGIPAAIPTMILIDGKMDRLLPDGEDRVRKYLAEIQAIDDRFSGSARRVAASAIGDLQLRPDEFDALQKLRSMWIGRLGNVLLAGPYENAQDTGAGGNMVQNIRVRTV